ncbi:hypothetical protein ACI798_06445 [Geodermatophilus sp. SYSU D01045]
MSDQLPYPDTTALPVPGGPTAGVAGPSTDELADLEEDRRLLQDLEYAELGGEG